MIEVKTVHHKHMPADKVTDATSMGKLCGSKVTRCYQIEDVQKLHLKFGIAKQQMSLVLRDHHELGDDYSTDPDAFADRFLIENYLLVNWVRTCFTI